MPSPRKKPQSRISSCKTYEEIRLEEIQAESAAYYGYANLIQHNEGGGKMARQKWTAKEEKPEKNLDFEVLSLEEIRKRRRNRIPTAAAAKIVRKVAVVSAQEKIKPDDEDGSLEQLKAKITELTVQEKKSAEEDFLKGAIKSLDELKAKKTDTQSKTDGEDFLKGAIKSLDELKANKSSDAPAAEETNLKKRSFVVEPGCKVPPVRLKRPKLSVDDATPVETSQQTEEQKPAESAEERLQEARNDVEVRVCDSSTDGQVKEQTARPPSDELLLEVDDGDDVTTVDDDILKDIDALLTDVPLA